MRSEKSVVSCQLSVVGRRSANDHQRTTDNGQRSTRTGVTLVELLIVILIITILAGLILGVAAVAGETARENHTRHVVERLHTLLVDYYDTLKTRRVRLEPGVEKDIGLKISQRNVRGRALAEARLYALRELILMEVPDRWSDVLLQDIGPTGPSGVPISTARDPLYLNDRTDLSEAYLRRYRSLIGRTNTLTTSPNSADDIRANQGAECLYMVITLATGEGEARSQLHESSIGDTDGDGAPEFLDGWRHPIEFLRWAPGYDSQIQLNTKALAAKTTSEVNLEVAKDHDPFDTFRAEPRAFRLVPLIYSAGRDEYFGVHNQPEYVTWRLTSPPPGVNTSFPYVVPRLTPYELFGGLTDYMGTKLDETATDNVDNHLMGLR